MEKIVKELKNRSDKFEIFHMDTISSSIGYKGNKLSDHDMSQESGYSVRFLKDKRQSFYVTNNFDELSKQIDEMEDIASVSDEKDIDFYNKKVDLTDNRNFYNEKIESFDIKSKISECDKVVKELNEKSDATISLGLGKYRDKIQLINSEGFNSEYFKNGLYLSISAELSQPGNMLMLHESTSIFDPDDINFNELSEKILKELEIAKNNVSMETGNYPVIFSPRALSDIMCTLESGLSGLNFAFKTTPLKDSLNEKILSDKVTLIDDSTIKGGSRTVPFDDEGIPARRKILIEKGVLKSFMHSLQTAKMTDSSPTGNGFRYKPIFHSKSYSAKPSISRANWIIEGGNMIMDEAIKSIKNGVYISMLVGSFMSNIISGEFSGNMWLGYKIENGKLVGRIKNGMISGNIYKLLNEQLIDFSKNVENEGSEYYLPYAYCNNVSLSC